MTVYSKRHKKITADKRADVYTYILEIATAREQKTRPREHV
jgi:hypothetical protein